MAKITFPVEASHIMMFARAIGDTSPVYHDAEAAKQSEVGGIIAPPTFVPGGGAVRPGLFPAPEARPEMVRLGQDAVGRRRQAVLLRRAARRADYEYHLPLHAGDVLTAETKPGKTWERESKRAGKLTFRERVTEYRNQKGELVVTARGVGVTTERPVDQG